MLIDLGRTDEAVRVLADGYTTAAKRGDLAPQKAIASLLEHLGQPLPNVPTVTVSPSEVSGDTIMDSRTGILGTRMAEPPMRGPLGQFIRDHFSEETWRQWIGQGTKVINELRLDFSKKEHQDIYEQQMKEWLQISDQEVAAYAQEQAV